MRYSIPYAPNCISRIETYDRFTKASINEIYFSDNTLMNSSRRNLYVDWEELIRIREEHYIKLDYVINPNVFFNYDKVKDLIVWLKGKVDLITISNPILLRNYFIRDYLFENFEVKNSINNRIDNFKTLAFYVEQLGIKKIILDRNVNRDLDFLSKVKKYAEEHNVLITLLANEGCIVNCPFKLQCDNAIAINNEEVIDFNQDHSCKLGLNTDEGNLIDTLQSPVIYPIQVDSYSKYCDEIKISGRTNELDTWIVKVESYLFKRNNLNINQLTSNFCNYNFNLLDLYETGFLDNVKNCKNRCYECNKCDTVKNLLIRGD